ncbi:MAG: hypothetical protein NTX05_08290 [Fusobacteria bacterium]|nr:hypothetical protein [Fusobacteriota bacterium]
MGQRKIKKTIKQKKEKFEFTSEFREELFILIKGKRTPEDIASEFVSKEIIPNEKVNEVISIISKYRQKKRTFGNILMVVGAIGFIVGLYFTLFKGKLLLMAIVGIIVIIAGWMFKSK